MGFPQTIRDEALVACGRRCSLCHKFCGLKIELHHIKHHSEGGQDTLDNCIPLCFDCHADMRSYDRLHPKGAKYSREELKQHRDKWYEKVNGAGPVTSQPDYTELDLALFRRILQLLPWQGPMEFLDGNNFAGFSFELSRLEAIGSFLAACRDPAFEFINGDLEAARVDLQSALDALGDTISRETFPATTQGRNTVPPEWEVEQPERFSKVVGALHSQARAAVDSYRSLIKLGRRKLAAPT